VEALEEVWEATVVAALANIIDKDQIKTRETTVVKAVIQDWVGDMDFENIKILIKN